MGKKIKRYLTKRQKAVIDDLLTGDLDEKGVLKKHRLQMAIYRRWLKDDLFASELRFKIESVKREEVFIFAKNTKTAATKLVQLTESDKSETARRACMDILAYDSKGKDIRVKDESAGGDEIAIDDETAGKIIGVLADGGRG